MIPQMNATDNSGIKPVVRVIGKKDKYSAGQHEILITATDSSGNEEACRYYVNVKSKQ